MHGFDLSMATIDRQQTFGRSFVRGTTGEAERDFTRGLAGFLQDHLALDEKDLSDVREVEISVELRAVPNAPRFDAAMSDAGFGEIRCLAISEQKRDNLFELRLIPLGGEMVVSPFPDEKRPLEI